MFISDDVIDFTWTNLILLHHFMKTLTDRVNNGIHFKLTKLNDKIVFSLFIYFKEN